MTPDYLKQWQEMSEEEKVSWIATEVMGWTQWPWLHDHDEEWKVWNPLTDWNHWRQVEEKVMVMKSPLWGKYLITLEGNNGFDFHMRADLPTRCQSLFLAYKSL